MNVITIKVNPINSKGESVDLPDREMIDLYINKEVDMEYDRTRFYTKDEMKSLSKRIESNRVDVSDWEEDENGYQVMKLKNVSLDSISHLTLSKSLLKDLRLHVYFNGYNKVGYTQVVDGFSDVGWFTPKSDPQFDNIKHQVKELQDNLDYFEKNRRGFSIDTTIVNKITKPKSVQEVINQRESNDYGSGIVREGFKFFCNFPKSIKFTNLKNSFDELRGSVSNYV